MDQFKKNENSFAMSRTHKRNVYKYKKELFLNKHVLLLVINL